MASDDCKDACVTCGCPEADHPGILAVGPCDEYRKDASRRTPRVGDVWRSRDRRDAGLIVTVIAVDGDPSGYVWIKRPRKSRVLLSRFGQDYLLVERAKP